MKFKELKAELKHIRFDTLRMDSDNYFEAVVVKDEVEKLKVRLEKFLGLSAYPPKDRLSSQIEEAIEEFGGIRFDQSLYLRNEGKDTVFAMLWPWQDGCHTTVKIIHGVGKYKTLP